MASVLTSVASGVGQILGRTYFVQVSNTPLGVPIPLAVLDVVEEEDVEYTAEITDHPVEAGQEISDHNQPKPAILRLKGKISNTPLDLSVAIANVLAGGIQAATSAQARSNLLNSGASQAAGIVGAALQGKAGNLGASAFSGAVDAIARTILIATYQNKMPFLSSLSDNALIMS